MPIPERLRKRLAPLLLVAGGVGAAFVVAPKVPHEHHVDLRLEDPASVTRVELAWAPVPSDAARDGTRPAADPVRGSSWRFEAGKAPPTVAAGVSLPDGKYVLDVLVERQTGVEELHREVTLGDADHITIPLRSPPR